MNIYHGDLVVYLEKYKVSAVVGIILVIVIFGVGSGHKSLIGKFSYFYFDGIVPSFLGVVMPRTRCKSLSMSGLFLLLSLFRPG